MSSETCQLHNLVRTQNTEIQYCDDCGLVHLTVGPLTLRFDENQFKTLSRDISKGLIQLHSQRLSSRKSRRGSVQKLHS